MNIPKHLITELQKEYATATSQNDKFHSAHEGYAVILEELEELKAEVFLKKALRNNSNLHKEALQIAAMAIRFIADIC